MQGIDTPVALAPQSIGAAAEAVAAAETEPELERAANLSAVPILIIDCERHYTHANHLALLAFHMCLDDLRSLRIDDLTHEQMHHVVEATWARFMARGLLTGTYKVATPDGGAWDVVYYAVSSGVPGRHVVAFSPAGWPENGLNLAATDQIELPAASAAELTDREREIVDLLAHGLTGEEIAARLHITRDTTRTHIRNAMRRMGAKTRAHLIALSYGLSAALPEPPPPSGRFTPQA